MGQQTLWDSKWRKLKDKSIKSKSNTTNFAKRVYKFLKNHKKVGKATLLDLGCGFGGDSIYFSKKGFNVTSVDFSKTALQKLKFQISKNKIKNIKPIIADLNFLKEKTFQRYKKFQDLPTKTQKAIVALAFLNGSLAVYLEMRKTLIKKFIFNPIKKFVDSRTEKQVKIVRKQMIISTADIAAEPIDKSIQGLIAVL